MMATLYYVNDTNAYPVIADYVYFCLLMHQIGMSRSCSSNVLILTHMYTLSYSLREATNIGGGV